MQSCLVEPYHDGKNSENGNSKKKSEEFIPMSASSETWQLGSQVVKVSHLEKLYWPQTRFTKGDILRYYQQIAHAALPYFKDRPVTLRLFPQGVGLSGGGFGKRRQRDNSS
jgi:bifunctional non-homologous end joining protein LigD